MDSAFDPVRECAGALERGDLYLIDDLMKRVLELAEWETDEVGRLIKYFAESLARRTYGVHPKFDLLTDHRVRGGIWDDFSISVSVAIENVIREKNSKVHIIHMSQCIDDLFWLFLMEPPHKQFKLSIIKQPRKDFDEKLGKFIDEARTKARMYDVKVFEVNSFVDIDVPKLNIERDEFVVVISLFVFSNMLAEPVVLEKLLKTLRDDIKPDLMIFADTDADHNRSDFLQRFNSSLQYYCSHYINWLDSCEEQIRYI